MIFVLGPKESRGIGRLAEILEGIKDELSGIRAASERIAAALENQEPPRSVSEMFWTTEAPQEEE